MTITARLALDIPQSTENVSSYPAEAAQSLGVLDNAVIVTQGTLASRPAATAVPEGNEYYATDTQQLFKSTGSVWLTLMIAGAWTTLSTPSGVTASPSARARREGDVVRLSGLLENTSGSTLNGGATIATGLPASYAPSIGVEFSAVIAQGANGIGAQVAVAVGSTTIALSTLGNAWPAGTYLPLEGLTYPLT